MKFDNIIKKIIIIFLITIFISGCNKNNESIKNNNEVKSNDNIVVLYFSATGTTKKVAQRIAKLSFLSNFQSIFTLLPLSISRN